MAEPRFRSGDAVRVRASWPPGHVRTPYYTRGRRGVVERVCGSFRNPEELAYNRPVVSRVPLYRVRFAARELWPDYAERAEDVVEVEIFQHWLEPA